MNQMMYKENKKETVCPIVSMIRRIDGLDESNQYGLTSLKSKLAPSFIWRPNLFCNL